MDVSLAVKGGCGLGSYGYRPGKSAYEAMAATRKRCWEHDWVLKFDIKGVFDNMDYELLMKAVRKHTDN